MGRKDGAPLPVLEQPDTKGLLETLPDGALDRYLVAAYLASVPANQPTPSRASPTRKRRAVKSSEAQTFSSADKADAAAEKRSSTQL